MDADDGEKEEAAIDAKEVKLQIFGEEKFADAEARNALEWRSTDGNYTYLFSDKGDALLCIYFENGKRIVVSQALPRDPRLFVPEGVLGGDISEGGRRFTAVTSFCILTAEIKTKRCAKMLCKKDPPRLALCIGFFPRKISSEGSGLISITPQGAQLAVCRAPATSNLIRASQAFLVKQGRRQFLRTLQYFVSFFALLFLAGFMGLVKQDFTIAMVGVLGLILVRVLAALWKREQERRVGMATALVIDLDRMLPENVFMTDAQAVAHFVPRRFRRLRNGAGPQAPTREAAEDLNRQP